MAKPIGIHGEDQIRDYLSSLLDPNFSTEKIDQLEKELDKETDPLKIAKLKQAIKDERTGDALKSGFVEHAQFWAQEEGIDAGTLLDMGVPDDVLEEAGFDVPKKPAARAAIPAKTTRKRRTREQKEDDLKEMRKAINSKRSSFTAQDIMEAVDRPDARADVQEILKEGLESGALEDLGPDPERKTAPQGAAPKVYNKVKNL